MARDRIPTALQMRELKYGRGSDAERDAVAQALRAAGRRPEAVLLFEGRPDHPFLAEERAWAVEHGSGFGLLALRRLGHAVSPADFRACAGAAEAGGRWLDAWQCWRALDAAGEIARIAEHLPPSLRPAPAPAPEPDA